MKGALSVNPVTGGRLSFVRRGKRGLLCRHLQNGLYSRYIYVNFKATRHR